MSYISSPGFCFSFKEMEKRGKLIYEGPQLDNLWTDIKDSINTTKTFNIPNEQKDLIISYLMEEPSYGIFELKDAYIIGYRWSVNGEYREFLLTKDYHIVESTKHKLWYEAYPFISSIDNSIVFNIDQRPIKR